MKQSCRTQSETTCDQQLGSTVLMSTSSYENQKDPTSLDRFDLQLCHASSGWALPSSLTNSAPTRPGATSFPELLGWWNSPVEFLKFCFFVGKHPTLNCFCWQMSKFKLLISSSFTTKIGKPSKRAARLHNPFAEPPENKDLWAIIRLYRATINQGWVSIRNRSIIFPIWNKG